MSVHITIDNEIIQKDFHKFVEVFFESSSHHPLENATMLVGEQVSLSMKKSSKIFHAMSWNILGIFILNMAKYLMTCHGIFFHVTKVMKASKQK
jgi:hypothetical protein